jgi:hypothetical protein
MIPNEIAAALIKLEPFRLSKILRRVPARCSDKFTTSSLACYLSQYYWDNAQTMKAKNWNHWRDVVHSFELEMNGLPQSIR